MLRQLMASHIRCKPPWFRGFSNLKKVYVEGTRHLRMVAVNVTSGFEMPVLSK